jgi:uncharacterized membrane protein
MAAGGFTLAQMMQPAIFLLAGTMGVVAGLRTFTPLAATSWAARTGRLTLRIPRLAFVGSTVVLGISVILAIAELITDKLPSTRSRTSAFPLTARMISGAICGALFCLSAGVAVPAGALIGALGAIVGAFAGFEIRRRIGIALKVPDAALGFLEDAIAVGGAILIVTHF